MAHNVSTEGLSAFSAEVLALVGRGGASAHDLRRMAHRGRIFQQAGESQYYTEPKRLAKLGYLEARKEPGRTRDRTVYTLTDKASRALEAYAATPATVLPLKSDALLRLLLCDLVGETVTRESLAALRADVAALEQRVAESEQAAAALPHRSRYLLIVTQFLRDYLELHLELVERAERELGPAPGG